jgi:hypothetical protein
MKHLSTLTAFLILLASPSLSVAFKGDDQKQKGVVHKQKKSVVPCRDKIDELVCTDDPDCRWDAKKSKCKKRTKGMTGVPFMRASFIARPTSAIGIAWLVSAARSQVFRTRRVHL